MRMKFIGAAAAAILASGLSAAMAQPPAETPEQATPPAMNQPGPTPDGNNSMMRMQPRADEAQTPVADHPKHQMSGCQKAIQASQRALEKSQASPDTIAQAWHHIENAKQEKGQACKDEAKQAQEML